MLRLVAGLICVQPISLFVEDKIVSLTLDEPVAAVSGRRRPKAPPAAEAAEEEEFLAGEDDDSLPSGTAATPLGRLLVTAQAEVEALAENGIAVRRDLDLLQSAARRLEILGLTACSQPLVHLVEALASSAGLSESGSRNEIVGQLLHAYYVSRLAADYETIETACEGLK